MSAQPLNTDIAIYLNVRSQRNIRRHDSVAAIINRLRPLVMSVVGREMKTATYLTFDTSKKDFSALCEIGDGFPIVKGLHGDLPFSTAQENLPDVDFAFQIGADKFITNTAAGLDNDLQGDLRDVDDSDRVTSETV